MKNLILFPIFFSLQFNYNLTAQQAFASENVTPSAVLLSQEKFLSALQGDDYLFESSELTEKDEKEVGPILPWSYSKVTQTSPSQRAIS